MSADIVRLPTFTQQRHAESERNVILELENAWLDGQLITCKAANADLALRVILAEQRTERAERWVRSRLLELTWPVACGAIAGGWLAVMMLWLGGL